MLILAAANPCPRLVVTALFTCTQNAPVVKGYEEDTKQISPVSTDCNIFVIFAGRALKLKNISTTFSIVNLCPSLPSVTKENMKRFHCLNIVLNNKTGPLF